MEVQFHKGTVNIPVKGSHTTGLIHQEMAYAKPKERRRTGREYRVYLVNRTTPETFFDYSGGCFSYQSYGGFFFFTTPGSKTFIPYHQIVRIEISG